ncbi:MAG: NAD(P)H-hydrate epimerase, partial [Rhodospirillales bacterium]|nr:NAD(P)H-hydrate epimerase [Rhodospirillales bacterium]
GYAMARHLHNRGAKVELFAAKPLAELVGDAATNAEICRRLDLPMTAIDQLESLDAARSEWASCDLIVDALFGTGMRDKPLPPFDAIIEAVTRLTGTQVLAVDIPSGLDCDTGEAAGACVQANATVTFVAKKAGFDNEASQRYTGEVHVADIGAPPELVRAVLHD